MKSRVMEHNAENRLSEETTPHVPAAGFHSLQKFREENGTAFDLNEVVSVDPSSAPRTFLDLAVAVQTPQPALRNLKKCLCEC